jgi:hypothetical protein
VKGFVCEPFALTGATEITQFGGWRSYLADGRTRSGAPPRARCAATTKDTTDTKVKNG